MCLPVPGANASPGVSSSQLQPQFAALRSSPPPAPVPTKQTAKEAVPNPNGGYDIDDGESIWTVPNKTSPISEWVNVRKSGTPPPEKPKRKEPDQPNWLEKGADLIGGLRDPNPNAYRK